MTALDFTRPFTAAGARTAGLSRSALRGSAFQSVFRGVYVASSVPLSLEVRARAALALHPRTAYISHTSAAELDRLPVPADPELHVTVARAAQRRQHPGIRCHVGAHRGQRELRGLRVSGRIEMLCELGRVLRWVDLVVAGEALAAREPGLDLRAALAEHRCGGSAQARSAVAWVRPGAESPMETRLRLLLILAGFPEPAINHTVVHERGHFRPDLSWPNLKFAVEYDGQHHRADLNQWDSDIQRREWFQRHGWTVVTVVARDVYRRPEQALTRILAAWRASAGPSFALSEAWRRHFPATA